MPSGARRLFRRLRGGDQNASDTVGTTQESSSGQRQDIPTQETTAVIREMPIRQQITPAPRDQPGLYRIESEAVGGLNNTAPSPHRAAAEAANSVDIIAVHGLGGGAYDTWTHQNGNFWLRDVAIQLPGARVYTYSYDAGFVFSRATGDLRDFARALLENIRLERDTEKVVPLPGRLPIIYIIQDKRRGIIFICHSMGGLVVKQVLYAMGTARALIVDGYRVGIPISSERIIELPWGQRCILGHTVPWYTPPRLQRSKLR